MVDLLEQESTRAKVPQFSEDERKWYDFKSKMRAYFCLKKLWDALTSQRPLGEGRADWESKSQQIYNLLVLQLHGDPLSLVLQFEETMDGVAAWMGLVDKYEPKGTTGK
eukprot:55029-Eustigmatos_ZCMA.PRE.1